MLGWEHYEPSEIAEIVADDVLSQGNSLHFEQLCKKQEDAFDEFLVETPQSLPVL